MLSACNWDIFSRNCKIKVGTDDEMDCDWERIRPGGIALSPPVTPKLEIYSLENSCSTGGRAPGPDDTDRPRDRE